MKTNEILRTILTNVFIIVALTMIAQKNVYVYKTNGMADVYSIADKDSISFTTPNIFSIYVAGENVGNYRLADVDSISFTVPEIIEGEPLYIAGEGSEQGQLLKYTGSGVYEIFTRLEADKLYYFSSEQTGGGKTFSMNAAGTGFASIANADAATGKVTTTGVYRIRLNFGTKGATVQRITKVAIRYCQQNASGDTELSYIEKGTWTLKNYNVRLTYQTYGLEDRYKFVITFSGQSQLEHYGKIDTYDDRPTIDREGYRDIKFVGLNSAQYLDAFKYPQELCDLYDLTRYYTDITLSLNADKENYTHNFVNYAARDINWGLAADSCNFILVDQFLNKPQGWFWESAKNVAANSTNNYWQQAYPMHTLLFSYERIKDSNPALAAEYSTYFDRWVANNGHNYQSASQRRNGFYNTYTDDMAWIALVLMHMEEVKGITKNGDDGYVLAAQIYDYMTETERVIENNEGWGLRWRLPQTGDGDNRNACTNTPAMIIACKLYQKTGTQRYLDEAIKMFDFMTKTGNRVNAQGRVGEPPLTYTQGTWIEACRLLYHITGDTKYKDRATMCISFTMGGDADNSNVNTRCITGTGILRDEGQSADQSNFKGGLIPYMINYINDPEMPADMRQRARRFLTFNAKTLWNAGLDQSLYASSRMFCNFVWNTLYIYNVSVPSSDANYRPGSLGAHNSGAALLEGMTRLND